MSALDHHKNPLNLKPRFRHLRNTADNHMWRFGNRGGVTLAFHYIDEKGTIVDDDSKAGGVLFSIAFCSKSDNFCRGRGREISSNRLLKGEAFVLEVEEFNEMAFANDYVDELNDWAELIGDDTEAAPYILRHIKAALVA